jgi:predicted GIY-YIG superfamily endonuclease
VLSTFNIGFAGELENVCEEHKVCVFAGFCPSKDVVELVYSLKEASSS